MGSLGPFKNLRYTMGSLWSYFSYLLKYLAIASSWEISFIITHQLFPIMLKETQTILQKNRIAQKDDLAVKSIITILRLLLAHCIWLRIQNFIRAERRNWQRAALGDSLGDSADEGKAEHRALGSNSDGQVDCRPEIPDWESADGHAWGELPSTREPMRAQCMNEDKNVVVFT